MKIEEGVYGFYRRGKYVIEVQMMKAKFKGLKWVELGNFGKRKFENILFIQNAQKNPKFLYV